jgi:hypothetical protein
MGWLRELMRLSSPAIDGYGELARRALTHPEWPPDTQPQARSLAALFSKLDRGIELEWLADRNLAQRCLALVLGCPIESVRRAVAPDPGSQGSASLRFDDLPYARPFVLRDEPLPPGVPGRVLLPSTWGLVWWEAPSGSGRSLVGQWLAARGLARFIQAAHWADVADRLPGAAPLFLELERGDDLEGLLAALPETGVCVAAPVGPPTQTATPPWALVSSPAIESVLTELLGWIEARVPRDGAFEPAAAEAWLRPPIAAGELPTLGAVLGAAGLLDARGVREARGKSLAALAEAFVSERLEQASSAGSPEAHWLERFGFDTLVRLAQSALTSSDVAWTQARSQDEWIALVPAELEASGTQRPRPLARPGSELQPRAVARAAREQTPGAYRIVRALIDADLLAERAPGRLGVCPEFLKHAVLARARDTLVQEASAFGWGEALLRPHAAAGVLDALYGRFAGDDFGAIEQLAELDAVSQPALVVASEACLVCAGLRALSGAEVPAEYLESVWNEQLAWLVELPGELPRPRLLCCAGPGTSPLARHPVWMLALLAASELLGERQGRAHPLLRPWGSAPSHDRLERMLDAIYAELARPEVAEREWAVEAFALVGRLLEPSDDEAGDTVSAPGEARALPRERRLPHPLALPAWLVQALIDGELDGAWLVGVGAHPLELRALQAACALRRVPWSRMAHALWKSWQRRGCPADGDRWLTPDSADSPHFWPYLPPEVLGTAWARWTSAPAWPFACFGPRQWSAFVDYFGERWQKAPRSAVWRVAFEHIDGALAEHALEHGQLLHAPEPEVVPLLACIWRRFPGCLVTRLAQSASGGDAAAVARLLTTAPHALDAELVRVLAEELSRRSTERPVVDAARAWLVAKVSERRSDWRGAYALLSELENRIGRAERARGPLPR